ncbi:HAD family hydrolase [Alcaligenaceae bacterium]|nr:HAD family hydrolase [Alcaligenaceae bacterium]
MTAAIFLDKDGTVLADVPYNVSPRRMQFAPGARAGLARLGTLGLPIIVVSNQPGVALGKFSIGDLVPMRRHLEQMFLLAGAKLDGFYYCPHHPQGVHPAYTIICDCRKPAPGLLTIAAQRRGIDLTSSWFVGDILDDVEAGRRAGCRTLLINNGNETEWRKSDWRTPDQMEPDLDAASRWICSQYSRQAERMWA